MSNDTIDRVAPTRRPSGFHVMKQRWEELLFLHWEVPAQMLQELLPPGLTLDTFDGRAFVGLVPFTMTNVRPRFVPPVPGLSDFHETNVRTYVHYEGGEPGVWFFSLEAYQALAVKIARWTFKLPYHYAVMELERDMFTQEVRFASERKWPEPAPAHCRGRYRVTGFIEPAKPRSLEFFLAERYNLYAWDGTTLSRGRVHHTPYPLQTAELISLDETLLKVAGIDRGTAMPSLVHYASSVDVDVWALESLSRR
ncbi:MAG: DUF2071 domain-containing protein [Deltaproteobacteria bacterium]|nr:DUF2071 domain-containing protein [Deltaproteobacteria bacterium]